MRGHEFLRPIYILEERHLETPGRSQLANGEVDTDCPGPPARVSYASRRLFDTKGRRRVDEIIYASLTPRSPGLSDAALTRRQPISEFLLRVLEAPFTYSTAEPGPANEPPNCVAYATRTQRRPLSSKPDAKRLISKTVTHSSNRAKETASINKP